MREKQNMKVLVTGGAGFIGSHLVDRLVEDCFDVRVLDDLSAGKLANIQSHIDSGKIDFVKGDIRDASKVKESLRGTNLVVHLAAQTSVPFSVEHPGLTLDVNLEGTLNLLRLSAKQGIKKFVFISSCAVYGDPGEKPIDEDTKTNPISPYAESKLLGEQACLGFNEKQLMRVVVFRLFNVYGPRQGVNQYSGVITHFLDRLKHDLPLVIYGDGSQTRDFIHVSNVVDAICLALNNRAAEGQVFNIGTGNAVSIEELARTLLDAAHSDVRINHEASRLGDIKHSCADISKAKRTFGFAPNVRLSDGLAALIAKDSKMARGD
jgi:UDP-glucose 4-epimerase